MCGISGVYKLSEKAIDNPAKLLDKMNGALAHRGPDDSGCFVDDKAGIYFGHSRLSIIDLSPAGRQPMVSHRGSVITYNGEIYNYREIRSHLQDEPFHSSSDTEVLLRLYEKKGGAFLDELNGMFALAIWDARKRELFLARDRAGIKPLYYTTQGGVFAFSSEIKAILQLPWVKREVDQEALYHFLTLNKLPPPYTMFRDIYKFHPGYKMVVDRNGIKQYERYWDVSYTDLTRSDDNQLEEEVVNRLDRSVRHRLVADVPVGAFLSGGVDSSAIVALMRRHTDQPIKTYSVGFADQPEYTEIEYARRIAEKCKTDHHEIVVTPEDIRDFLPRIVEQFDEPLSDPTSIPIYFISQLAHQQGSKVVLTGDGGDELFAGYRSWLRYLKWFPYFKIYRKLPKLLKTISYVPMRYFADHSVLTDALHKGLHNQEFFWGSARSFKESEKRRLLSKDFRKRMSHISTGEFIRNYRREFDKLRGESRNTEVDWMCYLGFKFVVPNFYLYRADRMGMAHSVEIRTPFMEHDFVDFALSIPGALKVNHNEPKYILKRALEGILPGEILYRRKMGFCVPVREWAQSIMVDEIEKNLVPLHRETGFFNPQKIHNQLDMLKAGRKEYTNNIWMLFFLITWYRRWMQ